MNLIEGRETIPTHLQLFPLNKNNDYEEKRKRKSKKNERLKNYIEEHSFLLNISLTMLASSRFPLSKMSVEQLT